MIKAVFTDRDGTLNPDPDGYIDCPERFSLYPGTENSVKCLNENNYAFFVITNQSGIARGYFGFEELEKVHDKFIRMLREKSAFADEIMVSPYHKDGVIEPWNRDHEDRKPGTGLFRKISGKYKIDRKKSFMIGDKFSDILFGKKCGLQTVLVRTGSGDKTFQSLKKSDIKPDFVCKDFNEAVLLIEKLEKQDDKIKSCLKKKCRKQLIRKK
ncbi:MAG: D,D-heptose 1,7-bisphosphate phosphatase [Candidatus Cloacimonadota bacterium]|nr:MAG: D,D-heptose 1,7-bisphosphate phosphatase [Candidatus Cloacimonadota bacterium]